MRKTKIICTLGPASESRENIEKLALAGMNVARINFSHGIHQEHKEKIDAVKEIRTKLEVPLAILLDTKGPEIRLKNFANGSETLEAGQEFCLLGEATTGDAKGVSTTYDNLNEVLHKGDAVLIDDGKVRLEVDEVEGKNIYCKVVQGGNVSSSKGVNLPGVNLDMEYLSDTDKSDLLFGIENKVDYVAASFVRRGDDVEKLRSFLDENGGEGIAIIAKIENQEGIENIDEILELADGIMVARGDLGVEVEFERIPGIQKNLIYKCCCQGKTAITATQMLESMTESTTPTRAEITDVANAVFDGTSAVMLSGETAVGKYPVGTVEAMVKILLQAEKDALGFRLYDNVNADTERNTSDAVARAACEAAKGLKAKAIIAVTIGGTTAQRMAKYKPETPIIAATPNSSTFYQLALTWGVYPIMTSFTDIWDDLKAEALEKTRNAGFLEAGDRAVISAGMPLQVSGNTNLILIEEIS